MISESTTDDFVVRAETGRLFCDLPTASTLPREGVLMTSNGVLGRADSGLLGWLSGTRVDRLEVCGRELKQKSILFLQSAVTQHL